MSHACNLYIYTPCVDSRGRFVNSGVPILQWEDDSNKKTYKRQHIFSAQNAAVAQTIAGIDELNVMNMKQKQYA